MANEGLKISNEGKSTDDKGKLDQAINTKYKTFMSKMANKISYTFPDSMQGVEKRLIAQIDHKLGYIPQATVKFSFDDAEYSILPCLSYYISRQVCPGCLDTCAAGWTACESTCNDNYNACADNALDLYIACLDARPMDQWYICDAEYDARIAACIGGYSSCVANCTEEEVACQGVCYNDMAYTNSFIYFMVDEQSLYIYFEIVGDPSTACTYPDGSFLDMLGRSLYFKYNISFSELKTSGEENGCNWPEFLES